MKLIYKTQVWNSRTYTHNTKYYIHPFVWVITSPIAGMVGYWMASWVY